MSQRIKKFGVLRNRWERHIQNPRTRWRSFREVAAEAGIDPADLTRAINAGFGLAVFITACVVSRPVFA